MTSTVWTTLLPIPWVVWALAWTLEGTIVASNGDAAGDRATPPNMVVEFDPARGQFVATRQLDTSGTPGGIFGIAIRALPR